MPEQTKDNDGTVTRKFDFPITVNSTTIININVGRAAVEANDKVDDAIVEHLKKKP